MTGKLACLTIVDAERFWARVDREGADGCWIWLGSRHEFGYGWFWAQGRNLNAHRVAWELTFGPIPDGLQVMHACDNGGCVNPAHLMLGTVTANQLDMARKGRSVKGRPRPPRTVLTDAQVAALRRRYADGERPAVLAREYGLHPTSLHAIARGARRRVA
jgi:hypothetical protein